MVKSSSSQQSSKKLVRTAESSHPGILNPVKSFVLKSNNTFAGRASDVFSRLNSLENEHSIWIANNDTLGSFEADDVSVDNIPGNSKTETFDNISDNSKTETFKKPFLPVRRNKQPNFIRKAKNTRVWRKYSLKDIPLTSDAKNAAVAFQFLDDLRKKREEKNSKELAPDDGKVTFRKPLKKNFGQSTSGKEVSNSISEKAPKMAGSSIKLDHLEDEFEEE